MEHEAWPDRLAAPEEDPEHAAIRDVIRRCTQAVIDGDFETYASFWGHTERATGVYNIRATGVTNRGPVCQENWASPYATANSFAGR